MRSKKAIINSIMSLIQQLVSVICAFIVPQLIIRTFGSATNGLITSISQFLMYITLLESGFGPVVKAALYKPIANKNKSEIENILKTSQKLFRNIAKVFIIYILVLCVIYPQFVDSEFSNLFSISLILILAISTFAEYFFGMTYKLYLRAEQETYIISIIQIIGTITNTIVVVLLIYFGSNIQVVKIGSALVFLLKPILQNVYVKRKFNINLKNADNNYNLKQKWDALAQHVAYVIHSNTDVAILTILTNVKEVSVYSVYLLVLTGIKNIVQAFSGGIDSIFGDMIAKGETENLNAKFSVYELIYHTFISITFCSTLVLIVPFVAVYTKGISDADYIRPLFANLMVFAEFLWAIRLPYNAIILAAGHFKETRNGAWFEAFINITISIILVFKMGIVGVAIGTLVAMAIRTVEFMYHTSKYILKRNVIKPYLRVLLMAIETIIILIVSKYIQTPEINTFITWILYAIKITLLSVITVVPINFLIYKNDTIEAVNIIKNVFNSNHNK